MLKEKAPCWSILYFLSFYVSSSIFSCLDFSVASSIALKKATRTPPSSSFIIASTVTPAGVVTIPQSELESIPIGGNVTMRPGTNLVKITTDPKVYAVEEGGQLKHIADEDTAETLYGEDWADRVVDVPDAFFVNYTDTGEEISGADYPQGSLVNYEGDTYMITEDGARKIDNEAAFEANRFQWSYVNDAPSNYDLPQLGDPITGAEEGLTDVAETATSNGDTTGPVGSGLTVALSNNTPASDTVPDGASKAAFTTINLTASNDGAVTVEDLTLNRYGVGDEDEAIITAGGVSVEQIDPANLESKLIPGLHFAGEILEPTAFTGGHNLQIAFSTGYLAGLEK